MKDQGRPRKKAGASLVAARVAELARLRLAGATRRDAAGHVRRAEAAPAPSIWAAGPGPPISDSQIRRYLKKADDTLRRRGARERERLADLHLCRLQRVYARAVQAGQHAIALDALRYKAELLGLYPCRRPIRSGPASP